MIGKESLLVGITAKNINSEDHYACFGLECLCMHVFFYDGMPMYIRICLDCLCILKAGEPIFVILITPVWCCALRTMPK
jgi:hypothetical protein